MFKRWQAVLFIYTQKPYDCNINYNLILYYNIIYKYNITIFSYKSHYQIINNCNDVLNPLLIDSLSKSVTVYYVKWKYFKAQIFCRVKFILFIHKNINTIYRMVHFEAKWNTFWGGSNDYIACHQYFHNKRNRDVFPTLRQHLLLSNCKMEWIYVVNKTKRVISMETFNMYVLINYLRKKILLF